MKKTIVLIQPIFAPNENLAKRNINSLKSIGNYLKNNKCEDVDLCLLFGGYAKTDELWNEIVSTIYEYLGCEFKPTRFLKNYGKAIVINSLYKDFINENKKCDYIFSVDSDIIFDLKCEKMFDRMVECVSQCEKIKRNKFGLLGLNFVGWKPCENSITGFEHSFNYKSSIGYNEKIIWPTRPSGIAGGCLLINKEFFESCGGYKFMGVYAGEDAIMLLDCEKNGYTWQMSETIYAIHPEEKDQIYQSWKGVSCNLKTFSGLKNDIEKEVEYANSFWDNKPNVDCVVLTRNANTLLKTCINSLLKYHKDLDITFYVGDTGTKESDLVEFKKFVEENNINCKIFENIKYNFAKNCNFLVEKTKNDIILFLNDDIEFTMPILYDMIYKTKSNEIGTVGCKLLFNDHDKKIQHCGQFIIKQENKFGWGVGHIGYGENSSEFNKRLPQNIEYIGVKGNTAACMIVKKELFKELNGFNEEYLKCFEDVEFNLKCTTNNKKNICIVDKYALHKESSTRKNDNESLCIEDFNTLDKFILDDKIKKYKIFEKKYKIYSSICCITKDCPEDCIKEFVNYHLHLGFEKIFLYNNSKNKINIDESEKIIIVEFLDSDKPQMKAYEHYIKNYGNDIRWSAIIDDDEFIVLKDCDNINTFLKNYEEYDSVCLNWKMFGSSNIEKRLRDGYINNFTKCAKFNYEPNNHVKSIINTSKINRMYNPHFFGTVSGKCVNIEKQIINSHFNLSTENKIAWINHYFTGSLEDWKIRRSRPRADSNQIRKIEEFYEMDKNCTEEDFTLIENYKKLCQTYTHT